LLPSKRKREKRGRKSEEKEKPRKRPFSSNPRGKYNPNNPELFIVVDD
jgi:hypothetical protein